MIIWHILVDYMADLIPSQIKIATSTVNFLTDYDFFVKCKTKKSASDLMFIYYT